jgi:hypothetical protein
MIGFIRYLLFVSIVAPGSAISNDRGTPIYSKFEVFGDLTGFSQISPPDGRRIVSGPVQNNMEGKKSVTLAALYSLLLPGMGELYAEGFSSGKYFLIAEGGLWLGYATLEIYGNSLRDDAIAFAASQAGINPSGKDDRFFVNVGNFLSTDEHDQKQLRDREINNVYGSDPAYRWDWNGNDAARLRFREERIASETMFNNRNFVIAAVIVNHVLSAINAGRTALAYNKGLESQVGHIQMKASVAGGLWNPHGIVLTVVKEF